MILQVESEDGRVYTDLNPYFMWSRKVIFNRFLARENHFKNKFEKYKSERSFELINIFIDSTLIQLVYMIWAKIT